MKDPRVEQLLNMEIGPEGEQWHYEQNVPLAIINRETSLKNQARMLNLIGSPNQAIDSDHVDELVLSLAEGIELPALLGYYSKKPNKEITIIGGNHRNEAYIKVNELKLVEKIKTDFYIVDNPYPWIVDALTRICNRIEGMPLSKEERIEQAKYLVVTLNYTERNAARKLGVNQKTLNSALQADKIREKLAKLGFTDRLSPTHYTKISRIKQDNPLMETAKLIRDAKLDINEATEVARRVEAAQASEKQQLNEITKIRNEYKPRISRSMRGQLKRQMVPIIKLRGCLSGILSIREESVIPLDDELKRRGRDVIKRLERIVSAS